MAAQRGGRFSELYGSDLPAQLVVAETVAFSGHHYIPRVKPGHDRHSWLFRFVQHRQ
jgi:hypothetical protein